MIISKEELVKEIEKVKRDSCLIIVEGKKDKVALEEIGLKNIFVLNETGKSLFIKIEEIVNSADKRTKCVILTDFDKKGKKIYHLVKKELSQNGIKMNNSLRDMLLRAHLSHIEGVSSFLAHLP
jgi:5S rRNA maturation endonuclease (ribonuclease M5)